MLDWEPAGDELAFTDGRHSGAGQLDDWGWLDYLRGALTARHRVSHGLVSDIAHSHRWVAIPPRKRPHSWGSDLGHERGLPDKTSDDASISKPRLAHLGIRDDESSRASLGRGDDDERGRRCSDEPRPSSAVLVACPPGRNSPGRALPCSMRGAVPRRAAWHP